MNLCVFSGCCEIFTRNQLEVCFCRSSHVCVILMWTDLKNFVGIERVLNKWFAKLLCKWISVSLRLVCEDSLFLCFTTLNRKITSIKWSFFRYSFVWYLFVCLSEHQKYLVMAGSTSECLFKWSYPTIELTF